MNICKFCDQQIDWITTQDGRYVPVDPDPVMVLENEGQEIFLDDEGGTIIGRKARPEEEHSDLLVAFVPHQRTCQKRSADFSRTCKGCESVKEIPWPVRGSYTEETVAYRCLAPGPRKGYVIGIGRFEPWIPAWCPMLEMERGKTASTRRK